MTSEENEITSPKNSEQNLYFIHLDETKSFLGSSKQEEEIFFFNEDYNFETFPNYFISYIEN